VPALGSAQTNQYSLRFFGTGVNQLDRARFQIDDNVPGPNTLSQADIGSGDFTVEFWVKGNIAPGINDRPGRPAGSYNDYAWIEGHVVIDRDIDGASQRDWGISLRGGRVEFGTGAGDSGGFDHTLVGGTAVLDGTWRHVAVVREAGTKSIYVDGVLDGSGFGGTHDISFPDTGVTQATHCSGQSFGHYMVLGAEKHDYDQFEEPGCAVPPPGNVQYPSFNGWMDEVRIWNVARNPADIAADRMRIFATLPGGLVAYWRFEEGSGTTLADAVPGNPSGTLIAGATGNGEWSTDVPAVAIPVEISSLGLE
jgi:hypothetical protein